MDEDLIRWCYLVAGYPRARLARDFECSIAEIEEIVSTGLAQILNPASNVAKDKRKPRRLEFRVGTVPQQTGIPKLEREQLFESVRRALAVD